VIAWPTASTSTEIPSFDGATIRLYGADVLVVIVRPQILADSYESQLLVVAFRARFRRTIVLASQDARGVPTYFGPAAIVRVLSTVPFDALSWQRYVYRKLAPQKLPIPIDPAPELTDVSPSWSFLERESSDTFVVRTTPARPRSFESPR
jgi:hypothetical protein